MSDAACKAAICDDEAQGKMMTACEKIESLKGATVDLRIKCSGIYIKAIKAADKEVLKVVEESGQ